MAFFFNQDSYVFGARLFQTECVSMDSKCACVDLSNISNAAMSSRHSNLCSSRAYSSLLVHVALGLLHSLSVLVADL